MCTVYHSLPYTLVVGVMKRLSELGHFWAPPRSATTTRADFLGPSCRPKGSPKRTHLPRKSGRRSRGERGKCWIPVLSTLSNGGTGVPENGFINWNFLLYKMDDLETPPILGLFFLGKLPYIITRQISIFQNPCCWWTSLSCIETARWTHQETKQTNRRWLMDACESDVLLNSWFDLFTGHAYCPTCLLKLDKWVVRKVLCFETDDGYQKGRN